MASRAIRPRPWSSSTPMLPHRRVPLRLCPSCQLRLSQNRSFTTSRPHLRAGNGHRGERASFTSRLRDALRNTKVAWGPIPVGLGIGFLGFGQLYRVQQRERRRIDTEYDREEGPEAGGNGNGQKPRKRAKVRPSGPWTVQLMSYLPLKGMSRIWGRFNELQIPYYLRVPGFRLYAWIFGVKYAALLRSKDGALIVSSLSEMAEQDLHKYPNLASFFFRELRPGVRPLAAEQSAVLSPADGRVLQFGVIEHGEVEQVKGMTYSLEALLGSASPTLEGAPEQISTSHGQVEGDRPSEETVKADEEFANINGISYTLPHTYRDAQRTPADESQAMDASTKSKSSSIAEVRADLALADGDKSWFSTSTPKADPTALYYCVVYLAPGDYHRFHSPASWVVEKRRHFAGELYSVSPYLQRTLPGLFTLNERVVLLGRWRYGFFSYTPVGATNVGSIRIHFDRELRTNSLTTDTAADRAAARAQARGEGHCGFAEATYARASSVLGGHALRKGEEMGGFQLGSTIVLVFEAPRGQRKSFDQGWDGPERRPGGWCWAVNKGQRIRCGEMLGCVDEHQQPQQQQQHP